MPTESQRSRRVATRPVGYFLWTRPLEKIQISSRVVGHRYQFPALFAEAIGLFDHIGTNRLFSVC